MKIAVVTDLHFGKKSNYKRRNDRAVPLLYKTIDKLNCIEPDITLILGDIVDADNNLDAVKRLLQLKNILDTLESPSIVIPGNHDCDTETFYSVLNRPNNIEEINGVRFLPFIDQEQANFTAKRMPLDLDRMGKARKGFNGPIVFIQHVSLFPPEKINISYNYTNAKEIIGIMHQNKINLSISGHYHPGIPTIKTEHSCFVGAPALCEVPFSFLEITIDEHNIEITNHQLQTSEHR